MAGKAPTTYKQTSPMTRVNASNGANNGNIRGQRRRANFEWDEMTLANKCQLCTYPDSIGHNIPDLSRFLGAEALEGAINGVHTLPVYKSTADRGYAPKNYREMDSKFGTWADVKKLTENYELGLDLMANHLGRSSEEFQDFLKKGQASKYAKMFIYWDEVFQGYEPTPDELDKVYTRKPQFPYIDVKHDDGSKSRVWNTFSEDQIDINPESALGREYICNGIKQLSEHGAKLVRLDAIGYMTKKRGTSCFFNEPEIWEYMTFMQEAARKCNVQLLAEVHECYKLRVKLTERGFWVYDFCLPMLVLNALHRSDAAPLRRWLKICPFRQYTCLDTHDGIGVPDVEGLLTEKQIEETEDGMCGCKETRQWTYSSKKDEFVQRDMTHQHCCTFYSSIQGRDDWYLLARAIQLFTPGIPMIYYVGLLAGENDKELAKKDGSERSLNRHFYSVEEAMQQLERPVVKALLALMRFRNTEPAFKGELHVDDSLEDDKLQMTWTHDNSVAELTADLQNKEWGIRFKCPKTGEMLPLKLEKLAADPSCAVCSA